MAKIHHAEHPDWVKGFEQGSLHVVCVASGGLTTCDFVASTLAGLRQEREVWPLTRRVNQGGETGTFWPSFALTVVPQTSWEDRAAPTDLNRFLYNCFLDVAEANRLHVKLPDMYVDLNPYGGRFDFDVALPIARQVLMMEETILNLWFAKKT